MSKKIHPKKTVKTGINSGNTSAAGITGTRTSDNSYKEETANRSSGENGKACSHCKTINESAANFCVQCGYKFDIVAGEAENKVTATQKAPGFHKPQEKQETQGKQENFQSHKVHKTFEHPQNPDVNELPESYKLPESPITTKAIETPEEKVSPSSNVSKRKKRASKVANPGEESYEVRMILSGADIAKANTDPQKPIPGTHKKNASPIAALLAKLPLPDKKQNKEIVKSPQPRRQPANPEKTALTADEPPVREGRPVINKRSKITVSPKEPFMPENAKVRNKPSKPVQKKQKQASRQTPKRINMPTYLKIAIMIVVILLLMTPFLYSLYKNFQQSGTTDFSGKRDGTTIDVTGTAFDGALLSIPRLGLESGIAVSGGNFPDIGSRLNHGPAFLKSSKEPGETGNTIIGAHRTEHGGFFNNLELLEQGDSIIIKTQGKELAYTVSNLINTDVGNHKEMELFYDKPAVPVVVLVTNESGITPGDSTKRIVVIGRLTKAGSTLW